MFDSVRNNKKIVQIFLGLITLPFAFWGVDSYVRNAGVGDDIAKVGGTKISVQQFEQALRERQDQMRQTYGASFKPEMMNVPEVRLGILNSMIDQRLFMLEAEKKKLYVQDGALRDVISKIPALQEDGKFSMERYESALRSQGMSQPQFEAKLRQDLMLQQLIGAVADSAFVSTSQSEAMLRLQAEERQFGEFRVSAAQFADKVSIEQAAVQKFYDDNKSKFEVPEQVKAEFAVLSLDALLKQATVSEAELKSWYESHKDKFAQPEERRASHILILANGESDKAKAKEKAESLLKQVQAAPAKFAELARQSSQDPGSAQKGGDLGFFGRGMMVKPFEDTVFAQKEGDISGVVESEFGYHIIKLTGIKAAKVRPMEDVRSEIEAELKRQTATRKFAEAAEAFSNMVYEQSESLQPAADQFKLTLQKSGWIQKDSAPQAMAALGPLANEKVLSALFSQDALKDKRNTEAVEIAPNTLLAARVVEHVPASVKPFETVKADVEKLLRAQEAAALAKKAGEESLAELKQGKDALSWSPIKVASRLKGGQLPPPVMRSIFKADTQKLPAYVGAEQGGDYVLYKIVKVSQPEKIDEAARKQMQAEYGAIVAKEDLSAYLSGLRARYQVEINASMLGAEAKDQQ
ncbi:SurA N-terminal domain-containing protein [Propionivibrio limicola]|uniref:SurA N-terminal domain-containing protein n=1 Tax=Propionivibrio limicola TaxID=167645 RepID=UPI0012925C9D|nr:SurA N-terminal domain-containing protein [Propionivibrio limicola]